MSAHLRHGYQEVGEVDAEDVSSVVHQALRREINEQHATRHGAPELVGRTVDVLCECARRDCTARIELAAAEYEAVRRFPTNFVVRSGHVVPDSERPVTEARSYVVVEKTGDAGSYAIRVDPRRRTRGAVA